METENLETVLSRFPQAQVLERSAIVKCHDTFESTYHIIIKILIMIIVILIIVIIIAIIIFFKLDLIFSRN